jgi:hypothetical protein
MCIVIDNVAYNPLPGPTKRRVLNTLTGSPVKKVLQKLLVLSFCLPALWVPPLSYKGRYCQKYNTTMLMSQIDQG